MIQEFEIPGRLAGMNEYINACRTHWAKGADMKKSEQEVVEWAIKAAKVKAMDKAYIRFTFYEKFPKNGRARDFDNISGFAHKVINDALQTTGVLPNDNWEHVLGMSDRFFRATSEGRIVVELEGE